MAMKGSPLTRSRGGFTLIEVLAALVIFGVAIVGIIEGVGMALSYQADLSMRQRAAMLASNILEEIKYSGELVEGEDSGQFEDEDLVFLWRTTIEQTEITGLMRATSVVSWGAQDNPREYSISALMYDQGAAGELEPGQSEDTGGQPPEGQAAPPMNEGGEGRF